MRNRTEALNSSVFSVDEVRSEGPFRVCRCSIAKSRLKREIKRTERRLSLPTHGFRPGRSPIVFTYRNHRNAIDAELIARLRKNPPPALKRLLSGANLPPEFTVESWDGEGPLVIVVRMLLEPSVANPAGKFGGMAGSTDSNPLEPQAGCDGSTLNNLPQAQSQLLASHGIGLGSSLAGAGSNGMSSGPNLNPGGLPAEMSSVEQPSAKAPGSPEQAVYQRAGNPSPKAATPTSPQPGQSPEEGSAAVKQALADSQATSESNGESEH